MEHLKTTALVLRSVIWVLCVGSSLQQGFTPFGFPGFGRPPLFRGFGPRPPGFPGLLPPPLPIPGLAGAAPSLPLISSPLSTLTDPGTGGITLSGETLPSSFDLSGFSGSTTGTGTSILGQSGFGGELLTVGDPTGTLDSQGLITTLTGGNTLLGGSTSSIADSLATGLIASDAGVPDGVNPASAAESSFVSRFSNGDTNNGGLTTISLNGQLNSFDSIPSTRSQSFDPSAILNSVFRTPSVEPSAGTLTVTDRAPSRIILTRGVSNDASPRNIVQRQSLAVENTGERIPSINELQQMFTPTELSGNTIASSSVDPRTEVSVSSSGRGGNTRVTSVNSVRTVSRIDNSRRSSPASSQSDQLNMDFRNFIRADSGQTDPNDILYRFPPPSGVNTISRISNERMLMPSDSIFSQNSGPNSNSRTTITEIQSNTNIGSDPGNTRMTSSFGSDPRVVLQPSTDPVSFGQASGSISQDGNRFENRLINRPLSSVTAFENKSNVVINGNSNIVGSSVEMNRFISNNENTAPQSINLQRSDFENNISRRRTSVESPVVPVNSINERFDVRMDPTNNVTRSQQSSGNQDPGSQRGSKIMFVDGNDDEGRDNTGNMATRAGTDPGNTNTRPNVNINLNFPGNQAGFNTNRTVSSQPGVNTDLPLINQLEFNNNLPLANQPGFNTNLPLANQPGFNTNLPSANQPGFNTNLPLANRPGFNTNLPLANQPGFNTNLPLANQPGFNTNPSLANQPGFNSNLPVSSQSGFNMPTGSSGADPAMMSQPPSDVSTFQRPDEASNRRTSVSDPNTTERADPSSTGNAQELPRFNIQNQLPIANFEATDQTNSRQTDPNFLNPQTTGFNRQSPTSARIQLFDGTQRDNMAMFDPNNMSIMNSNRAISTRSSQNIPGSVIQRFDGTNQVNGGNEETDPGVVTGVVDPNTARDSMTSQTPQPQPSNIADSNRPPQMMGIPDSRQTSRFSQSSEVGVNPQTSNSPGVRRFIKKTTTVRRFLVDPSDNQTLIPNVQASGLNTGSFARMNFGFNQMNTSLGANSGFPVGDPGTMNRFISPSNNAVNRVPQIMGVQNSLQTSRFSQSILPGGNSNVFGSVTTSPNDEDRQPVLTRFAAASDPQNRDPSTAQTQNSFSSSSNIDPGSIESRFGSSSPGNVFRSLQSVDGSTFGNSGFSGASGGNTGIGGFVTASVGGTAGTQAPQSSIFDRFGVGTPTGSGFPTMTANDNGLRARVQMAPNNSTTGNGAVSRTGNSNGVTIIETSRRNVVLSSENGESNGGLGNAEVDPPSVVAVNDTISCLSTGCPTGQQCTFNQNFLCPDWADSSACQCRPGCQAYGQFIPIGSRLNVDTCGSECVCTSNNGVAECTQVPCN